MEMINKEESLLGQISAKQVSRRKFMRFAGIAGASAMVLGSTASISGCKKKDSTNNGVDLGSGDIGILNYAYSLEQLEAAFYIKVVQSPYSGMNSAENSYLTDIRDHEIAHREFFKTALGAKAIQALEVNFDSINFGDRNSVLGMSKVFEDLGVSAYNGAGKLLADPNYLLIAGKIVSVEARHAALIRDLLQANSFAGSDVIDANGLDMARTPNQVLSIAAPYIKTKLNASNLPS